MKKYNIFLIFAQNIDCGYTLSWEFSFLLAQTSDELPGNKQKHSFMLYYKKECLQAAQLEINWSIQTLDRETLRKHAHVIYSNISWM